MSSEIMQANGWSSQNEKLYNDLSVDERHRLNQAMLLEMERTIPYYRKSFKQLYFLTLKHRPDELFTDRRVSEMQIKLLEDSLSKLKAVLKIQ